MKNFVKMHASLLSKGQLISKCLFGVFNFLQKMNKNKLRFHSSKVKFVRLFFGGNDGLKKLFPLCLTFTTLSLVSNKTLFPRLMCIPPQLNNRRSA